MMRVMKGGLDPRNPRPQSEKSQKSQSIFQKSQKFAHMLLWGPKLPNKLICSGANRLFILEIRLKGGSNYMTDNPTDNASLI